MWIAKLSLKIKSKMGLGKTKLPFTITRKTKTRSKVFQPCWRLWFCFIFVDIYSCTSLPPPPHFTITPRAKEGKHCINFICLFTVANKCRRIWFNEPIKDKAFTGHLIRTAESPNPESCQVKCYNEPDCVSINVGPFDGRRHKCELNNGTVENQASSSLQTKMDYTFYGIEVRCLIMRVNKKLNTFYMPRPPREGDSRKRVKGRKGKIDHRKRNKNMYVRSMKLWEMKKEPNS